jgi:hypothetical protein
MTLHVHVWESLELIQHDSMYPELDDAELRSRNFYSWELWSIRA